MIKQFSSRNVEGFSNKLRGLATLAAGLAALATLSGCDQKNVYVAPPPPKVTVAKPVRRAVTNYLEATGNAAAVNSADLVARVAGFVDSIGYQDGGSVKKGQVLFVIEPEPYDLKLQQAQAAEAAVQATLKQAQLDYDRQAKLVASASASQSVLDNATATRDNAQDALQQAEVNTKLADINVDYAHVAAPFDGVVTARQVSVGDYVGAGASPTVLATIVQLDPIYVNFSVSEADVLRVRAEMRRRGLTYADLSKVPVEVGLQNEEGYPHRGALDYAAPKLDQSTGTLSVRGNLANGDRALLPGMFVRVRVPIGEETNALLVPESALGADQSGRYLLVVGKDDVVEQRKVEIGKLEDALRVIEKGLDANDQVIVDGLQRAIPGQKVTPESASAAPSTDDAAQK
jgi:RND family efflux transporter MFP subunit